jgi:hypothetical protein
MLAVALITAFSLAIPLNAITRGGSPDDGEHPYVGLMVAYEDELIDHDGDPTTPARFRPLWRCSGSLISPTIFITAGHCVGPDSSADDASTPALVAFWFEEDVDPARLAFEYPWYELAPFTGVPHPHPQYEPDAFFLFDLGVAVLDGAGNDSLGSYASLPALRELDGLGKGRKAAALEAVGYGLQEIINNPVMGPIKLQAELDRRKADLFLVDKRGVAGIGDINPDQAILVSGDAAHGGTCFGDSGGPMLIGDSDVIGAVTSFGLNGNCAGVGGGYRLDQPDDLAFINSFLP